MDESKINLNLNQTEEEVEEEEEENDIPIHIKNNLGSIEDLLVPTIINLDIKDSANYKDASISPRENVFAEEDDDKRYESKLRYKYLKKHPELIDISEYLYLSCLKDKPEDIIDYCYEKFHSKDDVKYMKELKLNSRRLADN